MTEFGWDASDYDWGRGPMNIQAAKDAGISWFTHKATEGTTVRHAHYLEAMAAARAVGIPHLGAYHVVHTSNVSGQVTYLLSIADRYTPWWRDYPLWFWQADCERWASDFPSPFVIKSFCDQLATRSGKPVVVYASHGQYGDTLRGIGRPLWNAHYVNGSGPFHHLYPGDNWAPAQPSLTGGKGGWARYSGQDPMILQYTSSATIGTQNICDANAIRDPNALRAMLFGSAIPQVDGFHVSADIM